MKKIAGALPRKKKLLPGKNKNRKNRIARAIFYDYLAQWKRQKRSNRVSNTGG